MDEDLKDVGSRIGMSDDDIAKLKVKKRKELLYIILGSVIVTAFSIILGILAGREDPNIDIIGSSYPFAGPLALSATFWQRNKKTLIVASVITIIAAIVGFIVALNLSRPTYGVATKYGSYSRE